MPGEPNPLFDTLVPAKATGRDRLQGLVAYALYKQAKREWAGRKADRPTEAELDAYVETWTASPSRLDSLRQQAGGILDAFGDDFVQAARPGIREEAIRGSFGRSVWSSVLGAFGYSLGLLAIVLILKFFGVDILGLAEKIGANDRPAQAVTTPANPRP